jgi:hypothetical protein
MYCEPITDKDLRDMAEVVHLALARGPLGYTRTSRGSGRRIRRDVENAALD